MDKIDYQEHNDAMVKAIVMVGDIYSTSYVRAARAEAR